MKTSPNRRKISDIANDKRYPQDCATWPVNPVAAAVMCACVVPAQAQAQALEEVIVTATRRAQSVQDVPYNISAITADDIAAKRAFGFADFSRIVPGIAAVDQGSVARGNNNNFILRGLNAQQSNNNFNVGNQNAAAVSTYLGETPVFFAMTLKDIERIEVLRGPQGTLYGSGSVGGTLRFIPKAPDLEDNYFEVNASTAAVSDSDDLSYGGDFVVNAPIVQDELGFRLAVGYQQDPGFIDALGRVALEPDGTPTPRIPGDLFSGFVLAPEEDVNEAKNLFARASLLWQPSDTVDVTLRYQYEDSEEEDPQVANPGQVPTSFDNSAQRFPGSPFDNVAGCPGGAYCGILWPFPDGATTFPATGDNEQLVMRAQPYERDVNLANVDVNVDFGFATLTSASSFYQIDEDIGRTGTGFFEIVASPGATNFAYFYAFYPRLTSDDTNIAETEGFVQELRLASNGEGNVDWVAGLFYQDTESTTDFDQFFFGLTEFDQNFLALHANPQLGDLVFAADRSLKFEDFAVFGELTFHISERWQVTGGARVFSQDFTNDYVQILPFCGGFCAEDAVDPLGTAAVGPVTESFDDQIFKFNTSFDLNDDTMVYFTWAEGFRRGGTNTVPTGGFFASLPTFASYEPDEATNIEVGLKGTLGGKVNYTVAAYTIDWEKFQFEDISPSGLPYVINGNEAQTTGLEVELNGQLTDNFSFDFGYAYTNAEASEDFEVFDLPAFALASDPPLEPVVGTQVFDGDKLPGVPENTVTLGLDYNQPLERDGWSVNYHLDGGFRGDTASNFNAISQFGRNFFEMDSFWIWNGSVTLDTDAWSVGLFVRNIADEEGITGGAGPGVSGNRDTYFNVTRPQTVGLSFSYRTQ